MKTRRSFEIKGSATVPGRVHLGSDIEQTFLLEEFELSLRATDMIRRTRQLHRLYSHRYEPGAPPDEPCRKAEPKIPASIAPHELEGRIARKLREERVYLDEELTLAAMAHALDLQPHQLSRFLNIRLRMSFTMLVNSYRVEEAKVLLKEEPEDTILDIAFASGFNSKASFNRVFKRATGMTPSEYRMKVRCSRAQGHGG
ncbi:MAG TPA: helix-turn-helix domain-containing protein [Deltaproteobacteria bacterium]|nr:helix-turn-helix domain-containing protein [Deltaproteobacteria bacterium]HPR53797.1 helix-turn-helix domain-containing protein [Deltaproteobacteria bacterium]HXK46003.1 helix-turn-helix domain-containing protein [Deltaproteobacteria bacterium]